MAILELIYADKWVGRSDHAPDGRALKQLGCAASNPAEIGLYTKNTISEVDVPRHGCHRCGVP